MASKKTAYLGKAGSAKIGKSDQAKSAGASHLCPQCGSKKLWRDGLRYSPFGDRIQRWLCRNCGFRFSDPSDFQRAGSTYEHVERVDTEPLSTRSDRSSYRQICVTKAEGTKNLAK